MQEENRKETSKDEKEVSISVLVKTKDMTHFFFRHNYTSVSGWIGIVLSLIALVGLLLTYQKNDTMTNVLLLIAALLFTVIQPFNLWFKAVQQVKLTPMFKEPLQYILNQEGICVSQKEESILIQWEEVRKVIEGKEHITVYLSKVRAYILPKEHYPAEYEQVKKIIQENVDAQNCRWKYSNMT